VIDKRRLALQLSLLPAFLLAATLAPDAFTIVMATFLMLPGPIVSFGAAWWLTKKAREAPAKGYNLPILYQDAADARTMALISLAGLIAGVLVILRALEWIPVVPRAVFLAIIAAVLVYATVPGIYMVRRGAPRQLWNRHRRAGDPPEASK
jgi:hypothetical protein